MNDFCCIILAAGDGKRMEMNSPKVMAELLGKPMIYRLIESIKEANINDICVVTGFKHEVVEDYLNKVFGKSINTVYQAERKGTAHAVLTAGKFLNKHIDCNVLVLNGDAPFIDSNTIKNSYNQHVNNNNHATLISSIVKDPTGYGRVIRDKNTNELLKVVEHKDANSDEKNIKEVSSGAYWFKVSSVLSVLDKISNNNIQGEYYLPDAVEILISEKKNCDVYITENEYIVLGANDQKQLEKLNDIAKKLWGNS